MKGRVRAWLGGVVNKEVTWWMAGCLLLAGVGLLVQMALA